MLGAASSEDAATEDEVRSMLDPELTAALEHLDSTCIQAMLEDEGEVPPLQSANAANAASPAHTPADAASASEQTPLTKLLGSSLLAWRGTLRTLGYDGNARAVCICSFGWPPPPIPHPPHPGAFFALSAGAHDKYF